MSKSPINSILVKEIEKPLPVGMTEFNEFADRIISLAGKFADEDSMKWVLASSILHADAKKSRFSDQYFIDVLNRAAANQVASGVMQEIKERKAKQEAEAKQQAEATASTEGSPANEQEKTY